MARAANRKAFRSEHSKASMLLLDARVGKYHAKRGSQGKEAAMTTAKSSDTPVLRTPDTLEIKVAEHPFLFRGSRNKEVNSLIVEAVNRMGGVGDDAEEKYRRALEALKSHAGEVIDIVAAEYESLPEERYLDRWSLVQLLSELRDPKAVKVLNGIIASKIPPEKFKESHDFSSVTEEVIIRTTAVDGLAKLSANGVEEARRALLRHSGSRVFSIRRASVQGLMETGTDEDKKELRTKLKAKGEERLLKIRRVDVRQVPQATGGRFVVPPDLKAEVPPHNLGREER